MNNDLSEYKKQITSCIRQALSKSDENIFQSLCDVFRTHFEKASHSITEIKKKTTKQKGLIFEVFCKMFLTERGYDDVWMLNEIPDDILSYLNMVRFDIGIDLVARIKIDKNGTNDKENYFYIPVQAKYRKETKDFMKRTVHRVTWKDVSTFLALAQRTGPPKGWLKHMIITNADNVTWRGKKSKKDFTYAKKTFEKASRTFWMNFIGMKGNVLNDEIKEVNVQGIKIENEPKKQEQDIKELRKGFLDRFNK